MSRLAAAIEAIGERDRRMVEESSFVERMRVRGAMELYGICRGFVDKVNGKLKEPAMVLDPPVFLEESYNDGGPNLFQINLRGRLLQLEFEATPELYGNDDFRKPYVLRGAVRAFNQELLDHHGMGEQMIFYCPKDGEAAWFFFDNRTYRTGRLNEDYLVSEMEELL